MIGTAQHAYWIMLATRHAEILRLSALSLLGPKSIKKSHVSSTIAKKEQEGCPLTMNFVQGRNQCETVL